MFVLHLGDCLEVMKGLPDKSVDCFICDLPYGQLAQPHGAIPLGSKKRPPQGNGCAWDVKIDLEKFWKEVKRLCKNDHTPVLMFCNTKFGIDLINSNPSWFRYDLVWNKNRGASFLSANKMPMKSHEMIYVFSKKGAFYKRIDEDKGKEPATYRESGRVQNQYGSTNTTYIPDPSGRRCSQSVIDINRKNVIDGHPTEKPVELYQWLLERYVPDNGVVLDPTAGSFNSILVAHRLGFKGIGIEKDNNFFEKGVRKLMSNKIE